LEVLVELAVYGISQLLEDVLELYRLGLLEVREEFRFSGFSGMIVLVFSGDVFVVAGCSCDV
jgi:hypothetical protein